MESNKRLLVVVDFQKDFVNGSLGFDGAEEIYPGILKRVREYIENNDYVIFTMDTHNEEYLKTIEGKYLPIEHCIRGTEGHLVYGDELRAISEKDSIPKIYKGKFGTLEFINIKEKLGDLTSIELCGIDTNICVLSNAIICQTIFEHSEIYINRELCGSGNRELESKTFDVMRNLQMNII